MTSTRIFYSYPKIPMFSCIALLYVDWQLYRVVTGKHPFVNIQINGQPILPSKPKTTTTTTTTTAAAAAQTQGGKILEGLEKMSPLEGSEKREKEKEKPFGDRKPAESGPAWSMLDGRIPVPSFELMMRPWRRD